MLLTIPLIATHILIDYHGIAFIRGTGGWDLFSYLFIFSYGYLIFCNDKIMETIKKIWPHCLTLAILFSLTGLLIKFGIKPEISENTPILYISMSLVRCFRVLVWIFALIGLGEKYLNFNNRFLAYANEALLPFYILHQFVLLLIGYWVVQCDIHALFKYVMIAVSSFIVIMGLYDMMIKRNQVARFLFGLKVKLKS